ncbi:hypothetical protein M0802_002674 [Mischocyttarus mexicanus]|nr:hypothetical protein M0802_002674 [Mischocyttarus mexicanus]
MLWTDSPQFKEDFDITKSWFSQGPAPARSMQLPGKGNPRVPSPGPLRPYTPPDLSSIPHMDGTPSHNSSNLIRNNPSLPSPTTSNNTRITDEAPKDNQPNVAGPYIIGSPIDLGNIDNVDNIGLRLDPLLGRSGRGKTREHIELQETPASEFNSEGMKKSMNKEYYFVW